MPTKKLMNETTLENLAMLLDSGISPTKLSPIFGVSDTAVYEVRLLLRAAREGNIDRLRRSSMQHAARWAAQKAGIDMKLLETPAPAASPAPAPAKKEIITDAPDMTGAVLIKILEALDTLIAEIRATRDAAEAAASATGRTNGLVTNLEKAVHDEAAETRKHINADTDILYNAIGESQKIQALIQKQIKK